MRQTISVVVSAFNEEHTLGRCLQSVAFADEIIVVDNNSSDDTAQVAKKYTKHVYGQKNKLMLNENKNFGFIKATSEWILNLDADEVIPKQLAAEIQKILVSQSETNGYWIKRKNYSFGKWIQYGLWWPDKQLRLFRKKSGKFPCKHIHEYIRVEGKVEELETPYDHYNYESIHQYLSKIDRASTSEALYLRESDYKIAWHDALRFPVSDFLKIYFAQSGWKDGLHGLVLSLFQSFYSFCVFAKLWEMEKFPATDVPLASIASELGRVSHESSYWIHTAELKDENSPVKSLFVKAKRKLASIKLQQ